MGSPSNGDEGFYFYDTDELHRDMAYAYRGIGPQGYILPFYFGETAELYHIAVAAGADPGKKVRIRVREGY